MYHLPFVWQFTLANNIAEKTKTRHLPMYFIVITLIQIT